MSARSFDHRVVTRRPLLVSILALFLVSPAWTQTPDDSLLAYAVNIHQTPMQSWGPGYGIYLGMGLFLTAAHVAGHACFRSMRAFYRCVFGSAVIRFVVRFHGRARRS
jgi:hypothetical protein